MLNREVRSFGFAWRGIAQTFRTEVHFRFHCLAVVVVSAAGFYFGLSAVEWCLVVLCMAAVLAAETFNTAIEALTDLAHPDYHPLAAKAKDAAAGAVLLVSIGAVAVGLTIFLPKIMGSF